MNKKLHRVEVVLYVMAEDESDACWVAMNARFDVFECAAKEAEIIDPGWENAIPYNSDDERTCSEIFTSKMQVGRPRTKSKQMPYSWAANTAVSNSTGTPLAQPEYQS